MTESEARSALADFWLRSAYEALDSASLEYDAGHLAFAHNRAYYAAFYAASAVLLLQGFSFSKHSGVRPLMARSRRSPDPALPASRTVPRQAHSSAVP